MNENERCAECGMETTPGEYHPYAACLMFKASHSSDVVRANLAAVIERGAKRAEYAIDLLVASGNVDAEKVAQAHEIAAQAKPEHGEG